MAKYQTLCEFIAEIGGLREFRNQLDTAGSSDLRSIGADAWHKAKPFRKKLMRFESGMTPDDATLAAWQAGYFPQFQERPAINDLIDAIDCELAGNPVYTLDDANEIFNSEMAEYEREMTILASEGRLDAPMDDQSELPPQAPLDVPGRVIPENSELIVGDNGAAVYVYFHYYLNKKGQEGRVFYAKAFKAGQRAHAWHSVFPSHEARESRIQQFFA